MKISFIACEYNPFHNGHKLHINETKNHFSDPVCCVMSGNFVQRGDIALCEKHIRAKTAVLNGADLVLELPVKYATSTASLFAEGFVKTAVSTGLGCNFSFGAEGDLSSLREISQLIHSDAAEEYAENRSDKSISYAEAKARYISEETGSDFNAFLKDSNNILALEYLHAIENFSKESDVFVLKRAGVSHDSNIASENFASASFIRNKIYEHYEDTGTINGLYNIEKYIPENVMFALLEAYSSGVFPSVKDKYSTAVLSVLSRISKDEILNINSVNAGLENRIYENIRTAGNLSELFDKIKTKRYPHSRIRQIITQASLGISRDDINSGINYIRVLAFNDNGREILHKMKETSAVPVVMNLSEIDKTDAAAVRDAELDYLSGKLMNLCSPLSINSNTEYSIPPVYVRDK